MRGEVKLNVRGASYGHDAQGNDWMLNPESVIFMEDGKIARGTSGMMSAKDTGRVSLLTMDGIHEKLDLLSPRPPVWVTVTAVWALFLVLGMAVAAALHNH